MIKQFRKMRIIEMVEWERNTCEDIGNILIFMIGDMLIAYYLTCIICICIRTILKMEYKGKCFTLEGKLDKNELLLAYCQLL